MPGRVPRVAKLMALAIRFEQLVADGVVGDYAELSRLGHVTRARMTQIMNLLHLAPDIQEAILFLPRVESGRVEEESGRFIRERGGIHRRRGDEDWVRKLFDDRDADVVKNDGFYGHHTVRDENRAREF